MDKWAVATKRQTGWALYEDAAEVIAGECGRRTESRCTIPFLLNPITCPTNLKPFVNLPKEGPCNPARAFIPMSAYMTNFSQPPTLVSVAFMRDLIPVEVVRNVRPALPLPSAKSSWLMPMIR